MLKAETAEWLHKNSRSPISQHITYDGDKFQWDINLFDGILSNEIGEVLSNTREFHAQKADIDLYIDNVEHEELKDFFGYTQRGQQKTDDIIRICAEISSVLFLGKKFSDQL